MGHKIDWDKSIKAFFYEDVDSYTIEELYQGFKERLNKEVNSSFIDSFIKVQTEYNRKISSEQQINE